MNTLVIFYINITGLFGIPFFQLSRITTPSLNNLKQLFSKYLHYSSKY